MFPNAANVHSLKIGNFRRCKYYVSAAVEKIGIILDIQYCTEGVPIGVGSFFGQELINLAVFARTRTKESANI